MTQLRGLAGVTEHLRKTGWGYLFGDEFEEAKTVHWRTQWEAEEAVRELQWQRVLAILQGAYISSPFYRRRLQEAGWPVLTLESFARLPWLTRADIVTRFDEIGRSQARRGFRRTSGASSGAVVSIPLDRRTYGWYIAGTWRGLRWWGSDLSERAVILLGRSSGLRFRALARWAKDWVMNWRRIPVDDLFDHRVPESVDHVAAYGPAFIYGYPSAVHQLAITVLGRRWRPRGRLKVIVLTGEPVYAFQRQTIEDVFQCPVAEEYGSGELGCMAFECPERMLHIAAENVFLETVPTGPPLDNMGGRILATQLRNEMYPLIRYDTGDFGLLNPEACRCGRGLPVLQIVGRVQDRLVESQGATLARPWLERFFSMLPQELQGSVRVIHTRRGSVVLEVERDRDSSAARARATEVCASLLGSGWHVAAVQVERFARLPSGKLPYFARSRAGG